MNISISKSPYWIHFNFNPWKKRNVDDCAIRSISAATGLDYREVCKRLGVAWKNGQGLIRKTGIDLNDVKHIFNEYFDIIEDYVDDFAFVPDEFKDSTENDELLAFELQNGIDPTSSGLTVEDFIEQFKDQGAFLVGCVSNPNATNINARKEGGHLVYVDCRRGAERQGFYDTWDSSEMLVDAYMRVKHREPKDSPLHWKYDYATKQFII